MAPQIYRVKTNDVLGRYMVAARDIKQGELIFKELPVLVGPQIGGALQCFRCCGMISNELRLCSECRVALLCGNNCKGGFHTESECSYLKTAKVTGKDLTDNCQVIFPLRCLALKHHRPETFARILDLEPHLDKRRDTPIWRRNKAAVEDVLKQMGILSEHDLECELVQTVCGILDVNTFEIRPAQTQNFINPEAEYLRGLYPETAMMAHNCQPNVHLSVDDKYVLTVHARVDIKQDEMIFTSYANSLQGTAERRKHLKEGKYFECFCERCQDPTEFGTEISSLRCHKCRRGLIRRYSSVWSCDVCKASFQDTLVTLAIEEGERRISEADTIRAMEDLYKKLTLTFHPNHYLMLALMQNMAGLYSRLPPTKGNLNRKLDVCARLLSVFTKLEPGISRIKALTMYELQSAMVDISDKQYRDKEIDGRRLVSELEAAENILKEAVRYLLYDPPQSPEGRLAQVAMKELKLLRDSIGNLYEDLENRQQVTKKDEVAQRLKEKLKQTHEGEDENQNVKKTLGNGKKKKLKYKNKK